MLSQENETSPRNARHPSRPTQSTLTVDRHSSLIWFFAVTTLYERAQLGLVTQCLLPPPKLECSGPVTSLGLLGMSHTHLKLIQKQQVCPAHHSQCTGLAGISSCRSSSRSQACCGCQWPRLPGHTLGCCPCWPFFGPSCRALGHAMGGPPVRLPAGPPAQNKTAFNSMANSWLCQRQHF